MSSGRLSTIYVIQSGESDYFKIGRARNVAARLASLQVGNPMKLSIVVSFQGFERRIHRRFSGQRVVGEWFRLGPDDIAWLVSYASEQPVIAA